MRKTIMIVDDDADITTTLAEILEADGFQTVTASNGTDALRMLREGLPVHVILIDLMMPGMDGWQFLAEKQRDRGIADIAVMVMSASDLELPVPTSDFIRKPMSLDGLLAAIRRKCDKPPS